MKPFIFRFFLILFFSSAVSVSNAQLVVSNSLTPAQLAQLISGPGVQILNPQVHAAGGNNMYGKYNATNSNLNITEGLLLTTGSINNAVGPNNATDKTTYYGNQNTPENYPLLTNYTGRTVYEYCEFEFDIIPQGDTISFDFVFASEEYQEWVGSQYNDVFGFFISGPGIVPDPSATPYHNIALIPNTTTPITINNVNQNSHTQYYQNNNNGTSVQYDGFTKGLKAISVVQPCQTYHLKLVVADCSDKLWDSGVFIEKIKSNNILLLSQTAGGIPNMVEGCNNGTVSFTRQNVTNQPLVVTYWLGGSATNAVDYPLIGGSPNPATPKYITIPANQATANINVFPIDDGLNEGFEYMTFYLGNPLCSNVIMDSLRFYIQDSLYTTVAPPIDSICIGGSTQLTTTGGGSSFVWSPASGLNNANIPNPVATPTITTTYTLTTTASTCIKQKSSIIRVSNIALSFSTNNISCNGANNGSSTVTATNGFAPYTYSWTGPSGFTSSSAAISNLIPGSYIVTVIDHHGCSKTGTITIIQPSPLAASVSSPILNGGFNILCNGSSTGSATATVSGGTSPYTYSWSTFPIQTTATASNLAAGTYTVTIHDAHNCVVIKTITLTQPTIVTGTITSSTNVQCFGSNSGSATVSGAGGISPYTYSWNTSPIQTSATATNLPAGTYTVIVKDANNCTGTVTVTITQPASALSASITAQTNVLCRNNSTGSATVTASGGTSPYTYNWNASPVQTTATATNLPAGNYNVTVKDANNCQVIIAVTITQPASVLSSSITAQANVLCYGNNSGSASVSASGGTSPYSYSWNSSPVQNAATATGLIAGNYTCTITDGHGCTTTSTILITQPAAALSINIPIHTNVLCYGDLTGSANSNVTGGTSPYTYSWNSNPIQTTANATGLATGNYTVTVHDANNCSATATVNITQPASSLSASLSAQTNVLCHNGATGSATVLASGGTPGYSYSWNSSPVQTTSTATGLIAGSYTCTIQDANSCQTTVTVTITQPASALSATITSSTNVLCWNNSTGSATVTALGGSNSYSYSWNSTPVQNTATANNLPAGNYTVTVTDNNGCAVPVTATVAITEPAAVLNATANSPLFSGYNISCNGGSNGSVTILTTGGTSPYSYAWTGPSSYTSSSQNISGLSAGNYSLTVTDVNGCSFSLTTTVTEPPLLSNSGVITQATCPAFTNGAVDITVSGGIAPFTFSWTGPSAFTATTEDISGIGSGNYTVIITDANGCSDNSIYFVPQPSSIVIATTESSYTGGYNISCFGGSNGSINTTVSGGTPFPGPTYNYSWTGPSSFSSISQNISGLIAGTYSLVVTDQSGCNAFANITLTEPAMISGSLSPSVFAGGNNISCNGSSDGTITLTPSGGTPGYSYSWSGPSGFTSSSQNISGLFAGTYSVIITDANACTGTSTITLIEPAVLSGSVVSPTFTGGYNISCNGSSDGAINLTITGGTATYTYSWNGPSSYTSSSQNPTVLFAGSYSVIITDANGCTANASITLTEPAVLSASLSAASYAGNYNISCNGSADGSISTIVSGGTSAYTFNWSGPNSYSSSFQNPNALVAGTYTLNVTDANGCSATNTITLTEPALLSTSASSPVFIGGYNLSCNGNSTGSINLTVSGGTSAYTYSWSGPSGYFSTTQNPSSLAAGTYTVIVTDANSCSATTTVELTEPAILSSIVTAQTYVGGSNISCNGSSDGAIDLTVSGGTTTYSYLWSGPSSFNSTNEDISSLIAGVYNVIVTDANGCTSTQSITLTEPASLSANISSALFNGGYNISCNGASDGTVSLTITGGTTTYSYNWNNGNTTQNLNNVQAGTYFVIVTDANNCTITASITLTEPAVLSTSVSSPNFTGGWNVSCNGSSDGSIDLNVGGGTIPYNYSWTGPSSFTASTEDINGLSAGNYSVTVTDNNGCSSTSTISLTEPSPVNVSLSSPMVNGGFNIRCNGDTNGIINSFVTGGTPSYLYNWSGPSSYSSSLDTISSLASGTYTLLITDANGCTGSQTISISEPGVLISTSTPSLYAGYNISCNGSSNGSVAIITTGGATAYNYNWSGPNGFNSSNANINGLVAGTYSLITTDANGCLDTITQLMTEPPEMIDTINPSIFAGGNNISCNGASDASVSIIVSGGASPYSENWSGPNAYSGSGNALSGLDAGWYYVVITDANSCQKNDSIQLSEPLPLSSSLTSPIYIGGFNIRCHGDTTGVILDSISGGNPSYSYQWSGPNGFSDTTADLINVIAGSYSVLVTDTNGCTVSNTITITEPAVGMSGNLTSSIFPGGQNISCFGSTNGNIITNFSGGMPGFTFYWRGPNNFSDSTQDLMNLAAGVYDLVVTDTNGCQLPLSITLTEPSSGLSDTMLLSLYNGNYNISCAGSLTGSIGRTVNGGTAPYLYSWNGPSGYNATSPNIGALMAGMYYLTVADTNGCLLLDSVLLNEPLPLTDSLVIVNANCSSPDGSISLINNGGTQPYTYLWSNNSTLQNQTGLAGGDYSVIITDANGCMITDSATIDIISLLDISDSLIDAQCFAYSNGAIYLNMLNGTPPYNFTWSNGSTSQNIGNLTSGYYSVIISDSAGCILNDTFFIGEPSQLLINLSSPFTNTGYNISNHGGSDGQIDLTVSGGTSPYSYLWNNGSTNEDLFNEVAGNYIVIVTDQAGCSATDTIELTEPLDLELPTGFSPNNDGLNDFFVIHGIDNFPGSKFEVFNRWGNLVYEDSDYRNNWYGQNKNGENLPDGTYFIIVTINGGSITNLNGYVDLRR
ncbi:hypothetical protein BH09BAC5_BH09BAC5_10800 [soil metagenome]